MATLVQIAPTQDTVVAGISASYINQLNVLGAVGNLTYVTTIPSTAIIVFPDGAIETTGQLGSEGYQLSGTVSDQGGNSGVWSFTLTVVGGISPETAVTAILPALPNTLEIYVPFQIDPATGAVAVLSSYLAILEQHVATIIMTNLGERVMLPNYGYGLEGHVFTPVYDNIISTTAADITKTIQAWESGITVNNVSVTAGAMPNQLIVTVEFTVIPFNVSSSVTVVAGGSVAQLAAP